jgi:hypothetical protein
LTAFTQAFVAFSCTMSAFATSSLSIGISAIRTSASRSHMINQNWACNHSHRCSFHTVGFKRSPDVALFH